MGRIQNFILGRRVDPSSPPPHFLKIRSSNFFIISTICVAVFTDIFLYGIIVPVVPFSLTSRAGVPEASVQSWVSILLAVYGAALLAGSPISGWYADHSSSRRVPLLIGLIAMVGSTVMLCLAKSVALLVLGRIFAGLSASIVWTVGLALLVDTVGQAEIGETLGYVSLSMSLGILVAPLLGGVVYEKAGYYAVFYMSFGLLVMDIFLRLVLVEKKLARQWLDDETVTDVGTGSNSENSPAGNENTADTMSRNVNNTTTDEEKATQSEPSGTTAATPTVPHKISKWPAIFSLLKSKRLCAALWGCIVQASLMSSFDSVIPLFVQETFHWDSVGAGLIFLALMVPSFAAPVVGWVCDQYGPRWPCVAGFCFAIPFWVLLRLVTHDSLNQKVLLCALLALIGVSLTCVLPGLTAEISYIVEAKEKQIPGRFGKNGAYAQAYGLFTAAFAAGTLIGPIWAGYVKDYAGWGTMTWSLGLFSLTGALPCLIYTGGLITEVNAKTAEERAVNPQSRAISGPLAATTDAEDIV
ncbi:c0c59c18-4149-4ee3-8936-c40daf1feff5 [Sclerotinia trifoliorum]|uniref:C0c59c18-4149-4ee3-8936-c40daf1feff5 n=1 Tax=Sclerotinia trifoliorum TaxID=28548 RepID=A0A8H2VMT7_9HELO|nr:c0c59c18-4149-4ee3-8936-c40daf1feff5 [Sclerotinia trifoliorum]